jgi:hypothetical protein
MAKVPANMQRLIDQRDMLLREMDALRNKIAGLEMAISLLDGGGATPTVRTRSGKSVKTVLLDLLKEVGTTGLSAPQAVEMANRRGVTLNPGSVSSTLSRFKNENIVKFDNERYRLPEFVERSAPAEGSEASPVIRMRAI